MLNVLRLKPNKGSTTPTPRLNVVSADASRPASGNVSLAASVAGREVPMPTDIENLSLPTADTPGGSLVSASPSTATLVSRVVSAAKLAGKVACSLLVAAAVHRLHLSHNDDSEGVCSELE